MRGFSRQQGGADVQGHKQNQPWNGELMFTYQSRSQTPRCPCPAERPFRSTRETRSLKMKVFNKEIVCQKKGNMKVRGHSKCENV